MPSDLATPKVSFVSAVAVLLSVSCSSLSGEKAQGAPTILAPGEVPSIHAMAPGSARIYPGYDGRSRAVSTADAEAQHWFDQGLQFVYGFNHDEAIRSFRKAVELDPGCAMAWWGIAYASGIDVNDPQMSERANAAAYEAAQQALARIAGASPVERALIEAQAARYAWPAPEDRGELDQAYADAMGEAWRSFPRDPDVGVLYAESLMLLQPWDYWTAEGEPVARAEEIVAVLEGVLAMESLHPGANHFYIHAVEASPYVERAVPSADRLRTLVPGSGHLVHMPSHIYINVGRYDDAADANVAAIEADQRYFAAAPPPEFYNLYYIHNIHFLSFAAMMEGRYEVALDSALRIEREVPPEFLSEFMPFADGLMPVKLHVWIRFGKWEEILTVPEYPEERLASRAIRSYARAVALANLRRVDEARSELAELDALRAALADQEGWAIGINPAVDVLAIAAKMATGEIQWHAGEREAAYDSLRAAVELEDALVYDEPPGWMQPVRHALGALLLEGGRVEEALAVYQADLADNRDNAWSLLGIDRALRALGREAEAEALAGRLEAAWSRADVEPIASCYCAVEGS